MEIIKSLTDKLVKVPKYIEEILSDSTASYLDMNRYIQLDEYTCGVQATCAILDYYGKARSIKNVEKILKVHQRGYVSESAMFKLFRDRGLKISVRHNATLRTIKEAIDDYEAPLLTTIYDFEHWIVVYGYSQSSIFVLDSLLEHRRVKWSKEDFKYCWDKWGAIVYEK